jgi:ribose transport system ATP-binding protein
LSAQVARTVAVTPAAEVRRLSKTFGDSKALSAVDLTIERGSVHALMGGNGSGKSTLIKCLAGYHTADPGSEIYVGGVRRSNLGTIPSVAVVHQDLGLVDSLSVMENMALGGGFRTRRLGTIDWRKQREVATKQLSDYGVRVSPDAIVGTLSPAEKASVAIARALLDRTAIELLILDEPTASLPEEERESLLDVVRAVADHGAGVLYVSHRIHEVLEISTSVSVLRDGRLVSTGPRSEMTESGLIEQMMGRGVTRSGRKARAVDVAAPVLDVIGMAGHGVAGIDLSIAAGEIVAITGLLGAGQNTVARLVFGAERPSAGTVSVDARAVAPGSPASAIKAGIGYVPPDRVRESTFPGFSVRENMTLLGLPGFSRAGRIVRKRERQSAAEWMAAYDVRPRDPEKPMSELSGGNQQKAVIAKWMEIDAKVLILDEPTHGVDVAARAEIYRMIQRAAEIGAAILLVDTDIDELIHIADRVIVMSDGAVAGSLQGESLTRTHLLALTQGLTSS